MSSFRLESWSAIAPGMESSDDWRAWLAQPVAIDEPMGKVDLSAIPAMLRRRFNRLGKCAMAAAMPLVTHTANIPSIFASRHGDTELSVSLLESIGRREAMSPTSFSLAVHNAVSGLFSIARKDTSEITAIAAMRGLVLQTLFEAIGQLQTSDRLLCVIYDIPLPEFYRLTCHENGDSFPYAIAMVLNRDHGDICQLEYEQTDLPGQTAQGFPIDKDAVMLLRLLTGLDEQVSFCSNGSRWNFSRKSAC